MKFIDKILSRGGYVPKAELSKVARRSFEAAQISRLTADWSGSQTSIDNDIRQGGIVVRERARSLVKNNDYAKRYLNLARANIIGPNGFKLQMNVKELTLKGVSYKLVPDTLANTLLEQAFALWSDKKNASVNGRLSFRGISDQVVRYVVRDGEAFVRILRRKKLPYGLTLQVLDPYVVNETYNARAGNGNVVKMGVELDAMRRPVAYWLRKIVPELEVYGTQSLGGDMERVPADEMIHVFDQEYENQTRGISWLVQSMIRLKMLSGYEDAALVNARASAAKMGFFTSKEEGAASYEGEPDGSGNFVLNAEPGSLEQLPPGLEFQPYSPEYPTAQHEMFINSTLRGIASGLGVSFNMLANNLERVNYSSIRAGLLDERDMWKMAQVFVTEQFLNPVFEAWLEMCLITKSVNLPFEKFEKFNSPVWIGRRWAWVDPLKDVEAKIQEVKAGFETRTQVLAEKGDDVVDVNTELAEEKAAAEALGLDLSIYQEEKNAAPDGAPPDEGDASADGGDAPADPAARIREEVEEILSVNRNGHH